MKRGSSACCRPVRASSSDELRTPSFDTMEGSSDTPPGAFPPPSSPVSPSGILAPLASALGQCLCIVLAGLLLAPTLAWDGARMAEMAAPGCAAGGVLAFDYRVIHRGLPNAGRDRPVAYLVVAPEDDAGLEDALNFPDLRVADARPADVAAFPRWDEID